MHTATPLLAYSPYSSWRSFNIFLHLRHMELHYAWQAFVSVCVCVCVGPRISQLLWWRCKLQLQNSIEHCQQHQQQVTERKCYIEGIKYYLGELPLLCKWNIKYTQVSFPSVHWRWHISAYCRRPSTKHQTDNFSLKKLSIKAKKKKKKNQENGKRVRRKQGGRTVAQLRICYASLCRCSCRRQSASCCTALG